MTNVLNAILSHLEALVAFDTQNPPRALDGAAPIFSYLTDALPGFEIDVTDLGDGAVNVLARRGTPATLFNVHLDTVPATPAWQGDPFSLRREAGRCVGLGACDIKGAAATLLAIAAASDAPMALLFTSDEEAGQGRCIKSFLEKAEPYERVIVAEPTGAEAVSQHRGIVSAALSFKGTGAHASTPLAKKNNAIHKAAVWTAEALALANDNRHGDDFRLNVGQISGGIKPNVSAPSCELGFGLRPPPGMTPTEAANFFFELGDIAAHEIRFSGPALPISESPAAQARLGGVEGFVKSAGLAAGEPVDFWTEAALFGAAGWPALVLGPGDIAQAHTADEWVAYEQLLKACECYEKVIHHGQ